MPTLTMTPAPGERLLGFIGDRVRFSMQCDDKLTASKWRVMLRTDLGRAAESRDEAVASLGSGKAYAGAAWHDVALLPDGDGWSIELSLTSIGYYRAKAYAVDEHGRQHWPDGSDVGISVHPDSQRTANLIYCAFPRAFGATRTQSSSQHCLLNEQFSALDRHGYTLIPPSGTLRDLVQQVPHLVDTLGCRILHLLPINPTPTTYARFGRFGSPYAALDFTAIDPALVVFDKTTTAIDQFRELTSAVHLRGAQVFLDLAINHTGWGSALQDDHPEWFKRNADGTFHSPGAWGNTWADLVELDYKTPALWMELANAFLVWCRRGVDGFRCDAGYMVPLNAWQYITARVRQEFPTTVFLLEGLGGSWQATESLLTEGGMQWAYSELFQNYAPREIADYLDHSFRQSSRTGVLVNYSETHDNDRLAKGGRTWSLLRNRLCALTSTNGAFGFTCGVEWLATEKIDVHQATGLNWGATANIVVELGKLNRLLTNHPCFFDGAKIERLSARDDAVLMLRRISTDGLDLVVILINNDILVSHEAVLTPAIYTELGEQAFDLIEGVSMVLTRETVGKVHIPLAPGECRCLASSGTPRGVHGEEYRRLRAQEAWALRVLGDVLPIEDIGPHDWKRLGAFIDAGAVRFLAAIPIIDRKQSRLDLLAALEVAVPLSGIPMVTTWNLRDLNRVTLVPPLHWLLVRDASPFSASLIREDGRRPRHVRSVPVGDGFIASFPPIAEGGHAELLLERFASEGRQARGRLDFLPTRPADHVHAHNDALVLLSNGIGGMARLCVDLGMVHSKYDCLLAANLHPNAPSDRHVLAKRMRMWVNADGFITALNRDNLAAFEPGPPASWTFIANAGDRRTVPIELTVDMLNERNTTVIRVKRPSEPPAWGSDLPDSCAVSITMRIDIEDRSFHQETLRTPEAEAHFANHVGVLSDRVGFTFMPVGRMLRAASDRGRYHNEAEWCTNIPHPLEGTRGQTAQGDAYSPGWFEIPLRKGEQAHVVVCADEQDPPVAVIEGFAEARAAALMRAVARSGIAEGDGFGRALASAATAYVVRRDKLKTVIAGYPWFLDWGRDSLICARGLLAAGMVDEVRQLLITFARFEEGGTLPNFLHGEDASNRDTTDAPLWFGVVCEEAAALAGDSLYTTVVDDRGRTIAEVLASIASGYLRGTANGIRVDLPSGLVWSPAHFTWMDTNHPAGTPRQGYPIEIQALWIRLLRQLERLKMPAQGDPWWAIADRAKSNLSERYWIADRNYFSDLLIAGSGEGLERCVVDNALRSNQLLAVSLRLVTGDRARSCVAAAIRYLVVPGALRTLAPLPVDPPLAIHSSTGALLNNPTDPYWGTYQGDEDTRRKPAYHNGTAWTWTFPGFCEALAMAWDFSPPALTTARAYLGSMQSLLSGDCLGQIPEILDGDAPHQQRGCDAQAWGVTEALRVWKLLQGHPPAP